MTEERVIVKGQLGIEREQAAIRATDERIDFYERSIRFQERAVKAGQELHCGIDLLRFQPQRKRDLARLKWLEAHAGIDILLPNIFQIGTRVKGWSRTALRA